MNKWDELAKEMRIFNSLNMISVFLQSENTLIIITCKELGPVLKDKSFDKHLYLKG